jgi:hypothetical protein
LLLNEKIELFLPPSVELCDLRGLKEKTELLTVFWLGRELSVLLLERYVGLEFLELVVVVDNFGSGL